jgi:transcriptional regulator with XRE-family HTH domain
VTAARPTPLRAARDAQGWSQTVAARALAGLARERGVPVASAASLKTLLSRWENGHATPDAPYRALLEELYAESGVDLTPPAPVPDTAGPVARLRARLATAAAVDAEVVALWRAQLATAQHLDDRLGAAGAADAVRVLVEQLESVLPHLPDPGRHGPVAALLARACLLAGTQALDGGDPDTAVARFTRATATARDAGAADLAAAAAAGHADALVDVGAPQDALAVLEHARPRPDRTHPPRDLAVELAEPGFVLGHGILGTLGPAGAGPTVEQLSAALAEGSRSVRERAELHAELARACAAAGRADDAAAHARAARALATRIGSHRVLRLLDGVHGHRPYGQDPSAGSAESSSASAAR